jgi:hypothetical protein
MTKAYLMTSPNKEFNTRINLISRIMLQAEEGEEDNRGL